MAEALRIQIKKYLKVVTKLARRIYQALPLGYKTKVAHKKFVSQYMPWVLRASDVRGNPATVSSRPVTLDLKSRPKVSAADIHFPAESSPVVSIVIPVHGKCEYTLRCLKSIADHRSSMPYEVIVVDDHSPDDSPKVLRTIRGIRLLTNPENAGFIRTCNRGAREARGEYIIFLNNDTEVTEGWLDELVRTFHEIPGTGLVGSKLVYPDGRLQEAGGIIWNDGSAWNFGRDQDPGLPEYNYAREVDYCSGASIMMPKALFKGLGGFDEHYVPAYCEDSDMALKVRSLGYSVIYQPHSVVVHHEGVTSGTDVTQGVKAHQVANNKKLYDRWRATLADHQAPGEFLDAAKDRGMKHRLLILDTSTPTPDQDAGSVTAINMMYLLHSMGFQVTFIPEDNFLYMPDYTAALQRMGVEVLYHPYCNSVEQHLREHGARYDAAFLFRIDVAEKHLPSIREHAPQARAVFLPTDLHYVRMRRGAELEGDEKKRQAAQLVKQNELRAVRAADATIVHSSFERDELLREIPDARAYMSPLILNVPERLVRVFGERRDVAFVGGYQHTPNVDAVEYFVRDIMPIMRRRLPGVRFLMVGSKMPKRIQRLAAEDIIATGFVADLPNFLGRVRVTVSPLRYGAGVKGKVGMAMSLGLPVVSTSMGTEGMGLVPGESIRLADEPEAFVEHIVDLYQNESSWNQLSAAGLQFARDTWGAEASRETLKQILEELGIPKIEENRHPLKLWTGWDHSTQVRFPR